MKWFIAHLATMTPLGAYAWLAGILLLCGLGLPIPEDISLIAAGYFAWRGVLQVNKAFLVCFVAVLAGDSLAAPHLMPVEAGNILRRAALAGDISADVASLAHTDLLDLRVEFFPYQPCAERVWELRENVTCYDGWYVAVAELLDAPLATLDSRLANSPGPRCQFLLPPAAT